MPRAVVVRLYLHTLDYFGVCVSMCVHVDMCLHAWCVSPGTVRPSCPAFHIAAVVQSQGLKS